MSQDDDSMHELGKLTGRLDLSLPEETMLDFEMLARARNKKPAEYARDVLIRFVHGEAAVMRLAVGEGRRNRS